MKYDRELGFVSISRDLSEDAALLSCTTVVCLSGCEPSLSHIQKFEHYNFILTAKDSDSPLDLPFRSIESI